MTGYRARVALAMTLALSPATLLGAAPVPQPIVAIPPPVVPMPPAAVLVRYESALHALANPPAQFFEYSVAQLGLRNMEQSHRVYRAGRRERDETLIVDGYSLAHPSVRIIANRTNRYDIASIAPTPAAYRFTYLGATPHGSHFIYDFKTEPLEPRNFAVSEIEIEGTRFLPAVVNFKIVGEVARGSGRLAFGPADRYWVVREAQVAAHLTNGTIAHEHIVWSNYSFPVGLPQSTFDVPHARALEPLEPPAIVTPPPSDEPAPDQP